MQSPDVRFDDLRLLLAIQRGGSFLAAGRELGLSTSTVMRRVDALERGMGRPLVMRSTSGTALEEDARPLVALAEQMELGLSALRRDEPRSPSRHAGVVRLSVPEGVLRNVVEILASVRRQHPEIVIELVSEIRRSDLARRETDFGLRSARSSGKDLVEKKLGTVRLGLFAAQGYLDRRLPSATLSTRDFPRHDFIGFEGEMRDTLPHRWLVQHGATSFPFRSNSDVAIVEAARCGQGILLQGELVARDLGLVAIRTDVALPSAPLYLVSHRSLRNVPRMQVVARAIAAAIRSKLD